MKRFKKILYIGAGQDRPDAGFRRALELARTNGAALTLMDVVEGSREPEFIRERYGIDLIDLLRGQRLEVLDAFVAAHIVEGVEVRTRVASGTPFMEIIRAVLRDGHDLVVKAAEEPAGTVRQLFGSTDLHLLRKCPCPVWIDRGSAAAPYRTILAAVDPAEKGDDGLNRLILDLATTLAVREGAELNVVHAWQLVGENALRTGRVGISRVELRTLLDGARSRRAELFDRLVRPYGLSVGGPGTYLVKGRPATAISETAASVGADLIVMGTVARTGIPGFFIGNTAEELIQTGRWPVLAVKPANFRSPVTL
jgi:nucleotide-binding universal stress UspA family protein